MKRRTFTRQIALISAASTLAPLRLPFASTSPSPNERITGLDFPGSTWETSGACRFTFHEPLPAYPATYIWECYPRKQKGFYTTFFWGPSGRTGAEDFYTDRTYYGAHPYPSPRNKWPAFKGEPPEMLPGEGHAWEIAIDAHDILGHTVAYDRWYVQVLRVQPSLFVRRKHEYFTDVIPGWAPGRQFRCKPNLECPDINYENWALENPPDPALVWGDAPWIQARGREVFNGIIRGIRIYSDALSNDDIASEICQPLSTPSGRDSAWYVNMNPEPDNLMSEKLPNMARSMDPVWSTKRRARLWQLTIK